MSVAAENRTKSWDNLVNSKKQQRAATKKHDDNCVAVEQNNYTQETEKAIQEIKMREAQIEQKLGYSPFRPHLSFTGNGAPLKTDSPKASLMQAPQYTPTAEEEAELDDALAMILSLGK